jgi:hypothetical protein
MGVVMVIAAVLIFRAAAAVFCCTPWRLSPR